jgi:hypothetical protein
VLHDSFGFEFPTIAAVLDTTPTAARKLASRARAKVTQPHPEDRLRLDALRDTVADLLGMDEPRKRYAAMMSAWTSLRARGGTPHARSSRARRRLGHRGRAVSGLHLAPRGLVGPARPRATRWLRPHAVGGPGATRPCPLRRHLGAPGARRGRCSRRAVDPTRRTRRLGGRGDRRPTRGRPHSLVRTAQLPASAPTHPVRAGPTPSSARRAGSSRSRRRLPGRRRAAGRAG